MTPDEPLHELSVSNLVSGRTKEPVVQIVFRRDVAQLTVAEARQAALHLLECAEAAEQDAFMFWFASHRVAAGNERVGAELIREFREWRHRRDEGGTT